MRNFAIYTVITGDYDTIKQPQVITSGASYFLFTNNHSINDAGVWQIVYLEEDKIDGYVPEVADDNVRIGNIRLSRNVKMLAHKYLPKGYDMSIYLDADMLIKADLSNFFELLSDNVLMTAFRHSSCFSVMDEINDLIERGVVVPAAVENQWQRYYEWVEVMRHL